MLKKAIIIGGGYAGLSCAFSLARNKAFSITLIDEKPFFLETVKLHSSVHLPFSKFQIPYERIRAAFAFNALDFLCAKWRPKIEQIEHWQSNKKIGIEGREIAFDYLVLATGSRSKSPEKNVSSVLAGKELVELEQIKKRGAKKYLEAYLKRIEAEKSLAEARVSVIGGGPTAIQFLFEISSWFKARKQRVRLQLLHSQEKLMPSFPNAFHEYCYAKIKKERIDYYPHSYFLKQEEGQLLFQNRDQEISRLTSGLSFLFCGVEAHPHSFCTDAHGRVIWKGKVLDNIYSAGDCSDYSKQTSSLNDLSGQAALRKGRLVSRNIIRSVSQKKPELLRYLYPEMGAFVSLGDWDGIGWLFVRFNILRGSVAFLAKEAIEAQFRLFLSGIDSYFDI